MNQISKIETNRRKEEWIKKRFWKEFAIVEWLQL